MTSRAIYAVLILLLGPLMVADAYQVASIGVNAAVVGFAAIVTVSIGFGANARIPPWIEGKSSKSRSSRGLLQPMEGQVSGAAAGYSYSRQQVANLLATAYAVKSEGMMMPSYASIQDAREKLKAMADGDRRAREVFEDHRQPQLHRPRLLGRKSRESDYLSGLESAIRLVREGE